MDLDQQYATELTPEFAQNAETLIQRVGTLLERASADNVAPGIGEETRTCVASGWRSKAVNDRTSNTSAISLHLRGLDINLREAPGRALACSCLRNPDLLPELDL